MGASNCSFDAFQIEANGGGEHTPGVTAIRALRMRKDQLRVGHTIHPSDSGRQASERPPCCHKESAAAYPLRNLDAREPVEPEYPAVVIPVMTNAALRHVAA